MLRSDGSDRVRGLMQISMVAGCLFLVTSSQGADQDAWRVQEIETGLGVGYAVRLVDLNDDRRLDIVVVDQTRVVWYENPTWIRHTMIDGHTKPDNVCLAPYDIDRDGNIDFALGADWRFTIQTEGTLQWLRRSGDPRQPWTVFPIGGVPFVHRIEWVDLDADGASELIVVPLLGSGATPQERMDRPLSVLAMTVPRDPRRDRWPVRVLNDELHVAHNFAATDLDRDGRVDILVASFEGVSILQRGHRESWTRTLLGKGNQTTKPNRGASEIRHGRMANGEDYLATIEPWHGFQVVVYHPPASGMQLWKRQVIDDDLLWGHAVACANLDGDGDQELAVGVRDNKSATSKCGLRIYDPQGGPKQHWRRQMVDPGGVAIEDLAVGDLDADGKADLVAVGRSTHNIRIYWNQ